MNTRERTIRRLLEGMPKPRPFGRLIDGKFWKGHLSQHRTKQGSQSDQLLSDRQTPRGVSAAGKRAAQVHSAAGASHLPPVEDPCSYASALSQQRNNLTFRYGIG